MIFGPFQAPRAPASLNDDFKGITWQSFFNEMFNAFTAYKDPPYKVAALPTTAKEGSRAYATNGRKTAEGAGAGTGVPVYFSQGVWRVYSTDAAVAA